MTHDRRAFLLAASAAVGLAATGSARGEGGWYDLSGDDGKPVGNMRLPVELFSQIDELPGAIRRGASQPDFTLVEFFEYNCPWCRQAAGDMPGLIAANDDLGVLLVNNPMLGPGSKEAARVEYAVKRLGGDDAAYAFHQKIFAMSGPADRRKAMAATEGLGLDRDAIARLAEDEAGAKVMARHEELAGALAMSATPSYVIAAAGILGYPGPKALQRVIDNVRECELIVCK